MLSNDFLAKYQSVIPSEAFITKNFSDFCRMIKDRLIDIKRKVQLLNEKVHFERQILLKSTELTERDKQIIQNYINKLELDIAKWTKVTTLLHRLASSEKRMMKVFMNRQII